MLFTLRLVPHSFWKVLDISDSLSADIPALSLLQASRSSLGKPKACLFQAVGFKFSEF